MSRKCFSLSIVKIPRASAKAHASCWVNLYVSIFLICADTEIPQTSISFQSCWEKIPIFLWYWQSLLVQSGTLRNYLSALCMHPLWPYVCVTEKSLCVTATTQETSASVRQLWPNDFWLQSPKKTPHICNIFMALLTHDFSSLWSLLMKGMKN